MLKIDLKGQRFGRLLVIESAENKGKRTAWKCQCDCGRIKIVKSEFLKKGKTKSCGCIRTDITLLSIIKKITPPEDCLDGFPEAGEPEPRKEP